jgi:hypothetical protein
MLDIYCWIVFQRIMWDNVINRCSMRQNDVPANIVQDKCVTSALPLLNHSFSII